MPRVEFRPSGATVEIAPGTALLSAAQTAGIEIVLACGGSGTCGECLVKVVAGSIELEAGTAEVRTHAPSDDCWVRACQAVVSESALVIEVPAETADPERNPAHTRRAITREDPAEIPPLGGPALVRLVTCRVFPARNEDGLSDWDRFARSLASEIGPGIALSAGLPVLRRLAITLRLGGGAVQAILSTDGETARVIRIEPADRRLAVLGLAVDIGTTTIGVSLVDLATRKALTRMSAWNAQIPLGLDVISRINYAARPEGVEHLRRKVVDTVNGLIREALLTAAAQADDIVAVVMSGNTVMTHLALGLPPEHLRLDPYTPTLLTFPVTRAGEIGLSTNPEAVVHFSPCVGSYVGGDITAGLLCVHEAFSAEEPSLFIDIGTNGELVVGNRDFLLACACSAGPAFEGGGIECGMRATTGAIHGVHVDGETGEPTWSVLGFDGRPSTDEKPCGICGSGMIELVAELFSTGWLDPNGRFTIDRPTNRLSRHGRSVRYTLARSNETATGDEIFVSEIDVGNVLRAKAAIYSAASLLLTHAGLGFGDLRHFYVAGGFGRHLPLRHAVTIGLLPDLPLERFTYLGNASLDGSIRVLASAGEKARQTAETNRITYVNLGSDPAYMSQYTAALFLPHTDARLLPSVRAAETVRERRRA